jgi:hypothetical protein
MQSFRYNKATLFLTLFLAVVAFGVGTSAYTEPIASWPTNTLEPIDTGMVDQAKIGGLAVEPFFARGNADFKKDLAIEGVAQGGNPGDTTTAVQITSNVLVTGDIYGGDTSTRNRIGFLQANSLRHSDPTGVKTVCGDENGIVVFCADVCDNIDGDQPAVPVGHESLSEGQCTPIPDLCSNIDGIQQTLNQDITIDNPAQPTFCTQTIRGTIYAWMHGGVARNMANNAELASLMIKDITITSIGGDSTRTTWPSPIPLRFRWSFCSKWNPAYSGPRFFDGQNGTYPSDAYYPTGVSVAQAQQGECYSIGNTDPMRNSLPYQTFKWTPQTAEHYYTAWNGLQSSWTNSAGTNTSDPRGFFDAERYEDTGMTNFRQPSYGAHAIFVKKGESTAEYMNIKLPLERLILTDVKVPIGYRLELTTAPQSPGTVVETYVVTNTAYVANLPVAGLDRVNIHIPGGFGMNLPLDGQRWSDHTGVSPAPNNLPNGNYAVSVRCNGSATPNGTASPATFTLPNNGPIGLTVTCP